MIAGRYELRTILGRGGMGAVWRAWDPQLGREVAIKEVLIPPGLSAEGLAQAHARTRREARSAAMLTNPAVVAVHDVLEAEGHPWIVMQLVQGRTVAEILRAEGPLRWERVAAMAADLLGALREAHAKGVVHRDIKPGNVMLGDDGGVKLTDFGIATIDDDVSITRTGSLVGSPQYMAPERLEYESNAPAIDVWGLGATMYAAVEGASPFQRDTVTGTISAVLTAPIPPPAHAGPLAGVLRAMLDRDPVRRIGVDDAAAMLAGLLGTGPRQAAGPFPPQSAPPFHSQGPPAPQPPQSPQSPQSPPQPPPPRSGSGAKRGLLLAAALVVMLVLASAAVYVATRPQEGQGGAAEQSGAPDDSPGPSQGASAPVEYESYAGDDGDSVDYPAGWEVVPEEKGDFRIDSPDRKDLAYISHEWYSPPSAKGDKSVKEHALDESRRVEKQLRRDLPDYKRLRMEKVEATDRPEGWEVVEWNYTYTNGDTPKTPQRYVQRLHIRIPDSSHNILEVDSPAGKRGRYAPIGEHVLDSYKPAD
ncbi:serine/threonine-protein kinase [Murinocardiopsis flavida]|uniref:serine/threonine-protein kinase n=1 Tax=Murinocardiopsis flavida TaxID=645275 RepID=UPI001473CAE2|nr:serine/threonine-protein kinase [Murinocardiopsis flavida]